MHTEQLKGFSTVWVIVCFLRRYVCQNDLLHIKQKNLSDHVNESFGHFFYGKPLYILNSYVISVCCEFLNVFLAELSQRKILYKKHSGRIFRKYEISYGISNRLIEHTVGFFSCVSYHMGFQIALLSK